MNDEDISAEQIAAITAYVDIEAPPPEPTVHIIFGTNQATPATITADRYRKGLAPLIIGTGGINRVPAHAHRARRARDRHPL